jgi:hypothetical protein
MKSSTPLIRVVTEGLFLGAYRTPRATDWKLVQFLASYDGTFTVGGKFPSVEAGLLWRIDMPYQTFKTAMKRLIKDQVVTTFKLGYSTTYALTEQFLARCRALYDVRWERDLVARYHNDGESGQTPWRVSPDSLESLAELSRHGRRKEDGRTTTANAAPAVPAGEGDDMSDFPTDDGFGPTKKKASAWGGESEGTPLGGEDKVVIGKVVRSSYPSTGPVARMREQFKTLLTPASEKRSVSLWGSASKMNGNLRWLLERPDITEDALVLSFTFFVAMIPTLAFDGTSLWDEYFIRREELLHNAVVSSYGSRGGPREDSDALAARMQAKALRKMGAQDGD